LKQIENKPFASSQCRDISWHSWWQCHLARY
jgi:hypothetical protein